MTAATMTLSERLIRLAEYQELRGIREVMEQAGVALAAVTAERDQARQQESFWEAQSGVWKQLAHDEREKNHQARQMLADAEKKIASMELDESLREEDERFADPL